MVQTRREPDKVPMPGGEGAVPWRQWLREEFVDHFFPWGPRFQAQPLGLRFAGIGLAVVVTVAWLLAAAGRLSAAAVIAWWTGWSVYEFLCRRRCKPWVKEGPWWGRRRRRASDADLLFYVATKNLLIGAALFLALAALGALNGA